MRIMESRTFSCWLDGLKDEPAVRKIQSWIYRMARSDELFGDWKHIEADLLEFRFFIGPGYRVYASVQDGCVLILLAGGGKSPQARDIKKAKKLLQSRGTIQ